MGKSSIYKATITVMLRPSILDVQGKAVHHSFENLGMDRIAEVRVGKHIELKINAATLSDAKGVASEACKKLLANPVMEDFSIRLKKLA